MEKQDKDVLDTAIRETLEEVGLVLDAGSKLGRLDDQQGRNNHREIPLAISCFVFHVDFGEVTINHHEVGDGFWVSLDHLLNPAIESCTTRLFTRPLSRHSISMWSGVVGADFPFR